MSHDPDDTTLLTGVDGSAVPDAPVALSEELTAALATENNSFVAPAVAGAVVSATGIGLLVGGNVQAVNSLEPRR